MTTILVADDDIGIIEAIALILEDEGYKTETTDDGDTIIDLCERIHPDVLLLDIWMGGWNGKDLCNELKSNIATKHIPIIIISANRDAAQIAREAGADDCIEKPFDMQDLITKIQQHV